ncbi:MAG: hypothetical protein ACRDQA_26945 [Nocardioidaceae bacterium]
MASIVGPADIVLYVFPAAAVCSAGVLLLRRQWYAYLVLVLGLWLFSPELRRIVDWQTAYHDVSPILAAAPLASLLSIPLALIPRRRVHADAQIAVVAAMIACGYGFAVGLVLNGRSPAFLDLLDYVAPLGLGLFVLSVPSDDAPLRRAIQRTAFVGVLVIGVYGLVQFLLAPAWDTQWLVDSDFSSGGQPEPLGIRVFSTLDSPGPMARTLSVLLLLLIGRGKSVLAGVASVAGLLVLGLSLVRSAWLGLLLAGALLIYRRSVHPIRVLATGAVAVALLASLSGPILSTLSERVHDTVGTGYSDTSLQARLSFQDAIATKSIADPVGEGLGSTGVALKVAASDPRNPHFRHFDSGIFEVLTVFGSLLGISILLTVAFCASRAILRTSRMPLFYQACSSALAALILQLFFTNTLKQVVGALTWVLIGLLGRESISYHRNRKGSLVKSNLSLQS